MAVFQGISNPGLCFLEGLLPLIRPFAGVFFGRWGCGKSVVLGEDTPHRDLSLGFTAVFFSHVCT